MCLSRLAKDWWNNEDEAEKASWGFVADGFVPGRRDIFQLVANKGTTDNFFTDWNDCRIEWLERGGWELDEQDGVCWNC